MNKKIIFWIVIVILIIYSLSIVAQFNPANDFKSFNDNFSKNEWSVYSANPILSPKNHVSAVGGILSKIVYGHKLCSEDHTTFASVWRDRTVYHQFYSYHDSRCHFQIGHAISNDGKNWTKDFIHNPILIKGLPGDWDDSFVYCPIVWKENSTWYMVYTGSGHNEKKQVGLATALHPEGPWIKNTNNPIVHVSDFGWDSHEVEGWGLLKVGQTYHLWYDTVTPPRKIGLAISTDLINWEKDKNNPIFRDGRFCVCPFKRGSYYYLIVPHYTVGTDYTEFELYIDINPTFYPDNRKLIKIVKTCSASGWDGHDEDCPYILTTDIKRDAFVNNELWMYYSGERNGVWKEGLVIEKDIDNAIRVQ